MTETEGTFLVTHAEAESAVLKDVDAGQVHTLSENPGVAEGDVVEATLAPEPPMEVTWAVVDVADRRSLSIERSEEPPTARERELAADQPVGELTREPRAGTGEIHVVTVPETGTEDAVEHSSTSPPSQAQEDADEQGTPSPRSSSTPEDAVDDVVSDEATLTRAARMDGVTRVEVRWEPGVVSVRYLP